LQSKRWSLQPFPTVDSVARLLRNAIAALLLLACAAATPAQSSPPAAACPPKAQVDNVTDTYGTVTVADPYRWLEDQNSPETRTWIDAENKCTDAALGHVPGREALHQRIADLYHTDSYSLPIERSGRYFFTKRLAGQDLALIYMRRGKTGEDELLIDPLGWSKDHSASARSRVRATMASSSTTAGAKAAKTR